jgi:hypothetical protein
LIGQNSAVKPKKTWERVRLTGFLGQLGPPCYKYMYVNRFAEISEKRNI